MPRKRSLVGRLFKWLFVLGLVGTLAVVGLVGVLYWQVRPDLPDVETLREVQLQIPLRVYTSEGDLIAEYGEQRREPIAIEQVPPILKNSIIAAEDQHFYSHPGVAWQGLLRAAVHVLKTGQKGPGGSTNNHAGGKKLLLVEREDLLEKVERDISVAAH